MSKSRQSIERAIAYAVEDERYRILREIDTLFFSADTKLDGMHVLKQLRDKVDPRKLK